MFYFTLYKTFFPKTAEFVSCDLHLFPISIKVISCNSHKNSEVTE